MSSPLYKNCINIRPAACAVAPYARALDSTAATQHALHTVRYTLCHSPTDACNISQCHALPTLHHASCCAFAVTQPQANARPTMWLGSRQASNAASSFRSVGRGLCRACMHASTQQQRMLLHACTLRPHTPVASQRHPCPSHPKNPAPFIPHHLGDQA